MLCTSQHIQELLKAFFKIYLNDEQEKDLLIMRGLDKKSVPYHHRLSSLSKPHDAKRCSLGQIIFLSHTLDRFL